MFVVIWNITDVPGEKNISATSVDVYNKTLAPGVSLNLPAELVDKKVRKLEEQGLIAIGQIPPWYARAKVKGVSRSLTDEEMRSRIVIPAPPKEPQPEPMMMEVVPSSEGRAETPRKASNKR